HRERQAEESAARAEAKKESKRSEPSDRPPIGPVLLKVAAAAAVLLLLGGVVYYAFIMEHDVSLTAEKAWAEFDGNTEAANKKYKGKFVRITGKVKVEKGEAGEKLVLEGSPGAKWGFEITLRPVQRKDVQAEQTLTVRGRFVARKEPDSNVFM